MPLDQFRERVATFRTSFLYRLFRVFTLLTAFVSILFCTLFVTTEINEQRKHISEQLFLRTRNLADSVRLPLYAENAVMLNQLAKETCRIPEIRSVVISTRDGRILAGAHVPGAETMTDIFSETAEVRSTPMEISPETAINGEYESVGTLIGFVRVERSKDDLARMIRVLVLSSASVAIGFWLTISLVCYLVLRRVTGSFTALIHGLDVMQGGDFTSRIAIDSDDEPGRAARAINNLARALQQRSAENTRLQEDRLNLERQMLHAQKLESLGVMAGGIAHDYNNLLQSILGNIELAARKLDPDSPPHTYLERAINSGKHAAHLTSLMLTYVGKGFITKMELNLNDLVRENSEMLKTATSTAVSTQLRLSAELPPIVADRAQIQQVVMNLITNAAESITEQPGIVTLTTGVQIYDESCLAASLLDEKPAPGCFVFLEVSDNGCGMSAETLRRLFDPFFTTKFTGRGLGMSAVMGILRSHNGALFVESEAGRGTTFKALFPIPEAAQPVPDQEPVTPMPELHDANKGTLSGVALVVDDEASVLKVCAKMVSLTGLTVITASDGIDAVTRFREHADEIVVVLMDLTMPNMDGISAMNKIHSIRPETKVIISSGFNRDELGKFITGQTPAGFIRKPYSVKVLESELRRVMQTG